MTHSHSVPIPIRSRIERADRGRPRHRAVSRRAENAASQLARAYGDPAQLAVDITRTVLVLRGELDLSTRHVLHDAAADPAFRRHGRVDAAALTFVDAAGIGALVELATQLATSGVPLRIGSPSAALQRLSTLCRLDDVLGMRPIGTRP